MKKIHSLLVTLPIVLFALYPPLDIRIPMVGNNYWIWLVLLTGFAGLYTLFLDVSKFVKIIAIYALVNCFLSRAPYISFTAYVVFIIGIYYYILCLNLRDWRPVINALKIIILIQCFLFLMQKIGYDTLLNFGAKEPECWGVIGNLMQFKSFIIIAVCLLFALCKPKIFKNKIVSLLSIIILASLVGFYAKWDRSLYYFSLIRLPVWIDTLKLSIIHPVVGFGMSTYKTLFPVLAEHGVTTRGVFYTAHNCWLQILFEFGSIGFGLVFSAFVYMVIKLWRKDWFILFSLLIISLNMAIYFPTRQIHCVFMLLAFLAYTTQKIKGEVSWRV